MFHLIALYHVKHCQHNYPKKRKRKNKSLLGEKKIENQQVYLIATSRERMHNFIWLSSHKSPYWCPKMASHVMVEATTAAAVSINILEWRSEEPEYCFAEVTCMHTHTQTQWSHTLHITTPKFNTTPSKIVSDSLSLSLSLYIYISWKV